jgi:hypothetical protein
MGEFGDSDEPLDPTLGTRTQNSARIRKETLQPSSIYLPTASLQTPLAPPAMLTMAMWRSLWISKMTPLRFTAFSQRQKIRSWLCWPKGRSRRSLLRPCSVTPPPTSSRSRRKNSQAVQTFGHVQFPRQFA